MVSNIRKVLVGAVAATAITTVSGPVTNAHAVTWYPKHVKSTVKDATIFDSATGYGILGRVGACYNFYTDRQDYARYHLIFNGRNAWITANSDYVAPGHC